MSFFSLAVFSCSSWANQNAAFTLVYCNSSKINYVSKKKKCKIVINFNIQCFTSRKVVVVVVNVSFISQDIQVLRKEVHIRPVSAHASKRLFLRAKRQSQRPQVCDHPPGQKFGAPRKYMACQPMSTSYVNTKHWNNVQQTSKVPSHTVNINVIWRYLANG